MGNAAHPNLQKVQLVFCIQMEGKIQIWLDLSGLFFNTETEKVVISELKREVGREQVLVSGTAYDGTVM